MTEKHMPDCAALRCEYVRAIPGNIYCGLTEDRAVHHGEQFAALGDVSFRKPHDFQPGPCNCELGQLRQEVERLTEQCKIHKSLEDAAVAEVKRLEKALREATEKGVTDLD